LLQLLLLLLAAEAQSHQEGGGVLWGCAEFPKLAAFAAAAPLLLGRDTPAVVVEAVERQKEVAQRA
jgi:hypothetical protein